MACCCLARARRLWWRRSTRRRGQCGIGCGYWRARGCAEGKAVMSAARRGRTPGLLLAFIAAAGCYGTPAGSTPPASPPSTPAEAELPPLFRDVTTESGVSFTYQNGEEAGH